MTSLPKSSLPVSSRARSAPTTAPTSQTAKTAETAETAATKTTKTKTATKAAAKTATATADVFAGVLTTTATAPAAKTATTEEPLPQRRLPSLRSALVDPALPALALSSIAVPQDVVHSLQQARRVLVIGHAHPADGDCVASALALKHGLAAAGKEVVAVVDQDLPRHLRALDGQGELRRAGDDDVTAGGFDLVVLVDVAQSHRTGDMAAVVQAAPHVLVLDHHDEPDVVRAVGVGDDARLTPWIDVDHDAAAVLVGAAVVALGVDPAVVAADVAAGLYTDTRGATAPGTSAASLALLKGALNDLAGLDALERTLSAPLPPAVLALVEASVRDAGKRGQPVLVVDDAVLDRALSLLQQSEPRAVLDDLTGPLLNALDAAALRSGHAALLLPTPFGVRVSLRGPEALSLRSALSDVGGGKPGSAVAVVVGTVEEVTKETQRALSAQKAKEEAQLRLGR